MFIKSFFGGHMKTKLFTAFSVLTIILAFVSCGGGGESSTGGVTASCGVANSVSTQVTKSTGTATQYVMSSSTYASASGNYTSSMKATLSFSTAMPLSANLSNTDISSAIVSGSVDDGLFSGTLLSSCLALNGGQAVIVSTDSSGAITSLQLKMVYPQRPVSTSTKINSIQFGYAGGVVTATAMNDVLCTGVGTDGDCQTTASPVSSASASSSQAVTVNSYPAYSRMYVFSDSTSDNGRRLRIEGVPLSPYWQGRHANGPVTVEYLASNIGIPASKQTNYAVGGALSGHGNNDKSPLVAQTGMLDQLASFTQDLGGVAADPDALYFILGGGNDFTNCGNANCTSVQVDQIVANIDTLIRGLYSLGARHFYISGLSGSWTASFNTLLLADINALKVDIPGDYAFFDMANSFSGMLTYGLSNYYPGMCYTGDVKGSPGTVCNNVWTYLTWDSYGHFTTRGAHFVGDKMSILLKQ